MDRIQLACYGLIASAFFLASLLVLTVAGRGLDNQAHAEMVLARENLTLMTAQTRRGVESLFVLDNTSGRLIIYSTDARGGLELVGNADLNEIFARAGGGDGASRGNRR